MRKIITKQTPLANGDTQVETVFVGKSINRKTLDENWGIREEGFLDREREVELTLSKPKIYVTRNAAIRSLTGAKKSENVFIVRQIHKERFV